MTVNDTDKFLVNRSGSSYHLEAQNLMAELQDDDLMLVNRNSKSYKVTGAEIKNSLKPKVAPVIGSVALTEQNANVTPRFSSQKFDVTVIMALEGDPVSTKTIDAQVRVFVAGVGSSTKYLEFDSTGAVTDLLDTPQDPAYTTTDTNPTLTLTFPALFPTGKEPDEELGTGTILTVCAIAENSVGSSENVCDSVTPEDGAPRPDDWVEGTFPFSAAYWDAEYGHGKFVITGAASSTLFYSEDLKNWTAGTAPNNAFLGSRTVAFGNNRFVVGGYTGPGNLRIAHSDDGVNWSRISQVFTMTRDPYITFGGGVFLMKAQTGYAISSDGETWDEKTLPSLYAGQNNRPVYGDGIWLFINNNPSAEANKFYKSENNGQTFQSITAPGIANQYRIQHVAYGDNVWVATDTDRIFVSNDNLTSWTEVASPIPEPFFNDLQYNSDLFILTNNGRDRSDGVMYSEDGVNWTVATTPAGEWRGSSYGLLNRYIAVGNSDKYMYSPPLPEDVYTANDLAEQTLKFETYEYRRDVYQGEQAMLKRQVIAKALQDKHGVAPEMLDELIQPKTQSTSKAKRTRKKAD